MKSLGR